MAMMADDPDRGDPIEQRRDVRVKVHCELSMRWSVAIATHDAVGHTDNVSERGAMVSFDAPVDVRRGDQVEVKFTLPGVPSPCKTLATVRWTSAVLPGVLGLEFSTALDHDATTLLRMLARDDALRAE